MYQHFVEDNLAECLVCGAVGVVRRSQDSGDSSRIIIWKRSGSRKTYAEKWTYASVPTSCDKCWQEEREERARKEAAWKTKAKKESGA